jgi:hypothetical protein
MAYFTVGQIMENIAATVNQDPTQPTDGSADWTLWLFFINRAQQEWVNSFDWEVLKKPYFAELSPATNYSLASIGLPGDFRKLAGPVTNLSTGVDGGTGWPEVLPEDVLLYNQDEKWFYVQGDPTNGFSLQWNYGDYFALGVSGATISIPYYSMPTSLVSSNQYPVIPDSEFLTQRTIAYVLESRSDPRYQDEEAKAREKLLTMIENAGVAKYNSYVSPQPVRTTEWRRNFRFGKN